MLEAQAPLPFPCAGMLGIWGKFDKLLWGRNGSSRCLQNISLRDEKAIFHIDIPCRAPAIRSCGEVYPIRTRVLGGTRVTVEPGVHSSRAEFHRDTHTSRRLQAAFGIIAAGDCLIWQNGDTRECGKALFSHEFNVEPRTAGSTLCVSPAASINTPMAGGTITARMCG